jgi:nucleotide-binding universal stress UspA family protein
MSFKTILVHAAPGPSCNQRVRLAIRVADLFDASVTGLGAEAFDPIGATGYATADGAVIEAVRERIAADLPAAEKHFHDLTAGRQGVAWVVGEDYPDKVLALHARGADLIVASRPARGESATFAARPADLIMEAGGPVLLVADGDAEFRGEQIVVGWKDTRESRRAVSDALPFLMRAHNVVIVAVCGEANTQFDQAGLRDVARRLARHGVEASTEVVPKGRATVAEALEDAAVRHAADLIVVGAYGHSRLQEWMLGGVTEDLVASSSKFVLLSH